VAEAGREDEAALALRLSSGEPFAFAGVWDRWKAPDGNPIDSFSIITTEANELTSPVHNRMPVILKPRDYVRWLERGDPERPPVDLLRPYDADLMAAWKVEPRVGNVRNDEPGLCEPWACPPNSACAFIGATLALFGLSKPWKVPRPPYFLTTRLNVV
jgi:putative SOS response-associated peptidase YedK